MFDVITMGSNTIDAFADADDEVIDIKTKHGEEHFIAYPLGSKIVINEMRYDVGGNGVNVAVALSKLGLNIAYLGKIGQDLNGGIILQRLNEEEVTFIGARGDKSGFSVILDSELHKDRTILTYKGCNNDLRVDEVDFSKIETKWFYFTSMMNESFETMNKVADHCRDKGIKIAFNPSSTIARKGFDHLKSMLEKTDFLILNDEEAKYILEDGSPEEHLHRFWEMGIETVVITMGKKGLIAKNGKDMYRGEALQDAPVVETTGAGDSCTAAILGGMVSGKDFPTSLRMGMINAESVLSHYGAHNKLLSVQEMEEALGNDSRKIEKV